MIDRRDASGSVAVNSRFASRAGNSRPVGPRASPTQRHDETITDGAARQQPDHYLPGRAVAAPWPHRHQKNQPVVDRPTRLGHQASIGQSTVQCLFGYPERQRDGQLGLDEHPTIQPRQRAGHPGHKGPTGADDRPLAAAHTPAGARSVNPSRRRIGRRSMPPTNRRPNSQKPLFHDIHWARARPPVGSHRDFLTAWIVGRSYLPGPGSAVMLKRSSKSQNHSRPVRTQEVHLLTGCQARKG